MVLATLVKAYKNCSPVFGSPYVFHSSIKALTVLLQHYMRASDEVKSPFLLSRLSSSQMENGSWVWVISVCTEWEFLSASCVYTQHVLE